MLARLAALLLLLVPLVACGSHQSKVSGSNLVTEDVSPPPDAAVDPTQDQQEVRHSEAAVAGVLPGDFPAGLPVYPGASLVDFDHAAGAAYVVLLSPHDPASVLRRYRHLASHAGWLVADGNDPESLVVSRKGVRAQIHVTRQGVSSAIRIDY